MSDRLRWFLIAGCAVVAALHAPTAAGLIAQSWSGPYAQPGAGAASSRAFVQAIDALDESASESPADLEPRVGVAPRDRELATLHALPPRGL
jgi:hypothetical protein